jgi:hypothetical protein
MTRNFWDRIVGGVRTLEVMRLAQQVAVAVGPTVRESALTGSLPLGRAEARGYLRAKSTPAIRPRVEEAARQAELSHAAKEMLFEEAADRTVRLVLDDLIRIRVRQVHTRRAA